MTVEESPQRTIKVQMYLCDTVRNNLPDFEDERLRHQLTTLVMGSYYDLLVAELRAIAGQTSNRHDQDIARQILVHHGLTG